MLINVRGALGTQILEVFTGLIFAKRAETHVDMIRINVGGDIAPHVQVDYLTPLFKFGAPISVVKGTNKQGKWTCQAFIDVVENMDWLRNYQKFDNKSFRTWSSSQQHILHYRSKDRQTVSDDTYQDIKDQVLGERYFVIGDNHHKLRTLFPYASASGTPIEDWLRCVYADKIISSPTTFTLSSLFFDPEKTLEIIPESMCDGHHQFPPEAWKELSKLIESNVFPNLKWYQR